MESESLTEVEELARAAAVEIFQDESRWHQFQHIAKRAISAAKGWQALSPHDFLHAYLEQEFERI